MRALQKSTRWRLNIFITSHLASGYVLKTRLRALLVTGNKGVVSDAVTTELLGAAQGTCSLWPMLTLIVNGVSTVHPRTNSTVKSVDDITRPH